jgi:hypothetical protein
MAAGEHLRLAVDRAARLDARARQHAERDGILTSDRLFGVYTIAMPRPGDARYAAAYDACGVIGSVRPRAKIAGMGNMLTNPAIVRS